MSELSLPQGLVIPSQQLGPDHDHVIVSVNAPKRVEEEEIESHDEVHTAVDDADVDIGSADDTDAEE